jgi:two-component system, NarL family, sensor histidine kinase EvgS
MSLTAEKTPSLIRPFRSARWRSWAIGLACWCFAALAWGQSVLPLTNAERAWIEAHPVLKVGVAVEFPPYYFADTQGRYEGFVIDLMSRLAKRAGLQLDYRRYEVFADVLGSMQRGDIDLIPFTSETESRRAYMRFVRPLFSTQMVVVTDRRIADVSPDAQFEAYRVAAERMSTAAELLRERYPKARLQEYDNAEQAVLAVATGSADVYVGFRQVAVYFMEKHLTANLVLRGTIPTPGTALGPAVRKDAVELAGILEKAVNDLTTEDIAALAGKWLPRSVVGTQPQGKVELNAAQQSWIRDHGSVRLGFDADFAPIAFANRAGGFDGLAADITRAMAAKVGVIVALEEGGRFADVYDRARRGELDLIVAAARNAERSRDFDFVGPFLRVPTVVVAANERGFSNGLDAPGAQRLALLRRHFLIPVLISRHPNLKLQEYDSQAEVLQAVRRGEADLAIGNMKVVTQLLEARHAGALQVIGIVPDGDSELYFAVRNTMPVLAGVLRAGLDALTPAERAEFESRWLRVQWSEGVPWARVLLIGVVGLLLAAGVIGVLWWSNRRLRLAQQTLQRATRLAEEQADARAGFIAYLSHEMRGALGGIVGGLGLVEDSNALQGQPKQQQLAGAMRYSAKGLLDLCERTLDFERMLQGGMDLHPAPALLAEVIDGALASWRVQAELKGLTLQLKLAFGSATIVECDAVRLTQVLQNLVGNAVKFTARGGVQVMATLEPDATQRVTLCVSVIDTGPGIAADERERLFSPFAQGAAGRLTRHGAGLGLSISRRIAEAMEGSVTLEASSPQGSRFVVRVPVRMLAEPAGLVAAATA